MPDPDITRLLETQIRTLERNLNQRLDSQDQTLTRIEGKVDKTNGRVTALELGRAHAAGFRSAFHWVEGLVIAAMTAGATAFVTLVVH